MQKTVAEIARLVEGKLLCGDPEARIDGFAGIQHARPGDLSFFQDRKYIDQLQQTEASAVLIPLSDETPAATTALIAVAEPQLVFNELIEQMHDFVARPGGISPQASIAGDAVIAEDVTIEENVVIRSSVTIGKGCFIQAGCFLGEGVTMGESCHLAPHVCLMHGSKLGDRVQVHPGSVIGGDGFGYVSGDMGHQKIPHIGTVVIENDVEIGANVSIDRARLDQTVIGEGTKIDNLVHIGHNVRLGKRCMLLAHVGVAGSVETGDQVILAGQSGITGHLKIGDRVIVASKAGVTHDLASNQTVAGFPAHSHSRFKRSAAALKQLPETMKRLKHLEAEVQRLQQEMDNLS